MIQRMSKLDRILKLVHLLAEPGEGLTLDEMADALDVNRRTAERMRNIVALHFDVEERQDDRRKRFRIRESLRRAFARPSVAELAALQTEADARTREGSAQGPMLVSLLGKLKGSFDAVEKRSLDPDLDPLSRLQRLPFRPGPIVEATPDALHAAQQAILLGHCLEFAYWRDGAEEAKHRCVIPYGLIHGPVTYLLGKFPDRDGDPVPFRLDRMEEAVVSAQRGVPPESWNLDAWMAGSVSIWREEQQYDVVLRVLPDAVELARNWRFHPAQIIDEDGDCLIVRFRSGGLWQIADHVFTWRGQVVIEGPEELKDEMRGRVSVGQIINGAFEPGRDCQIDS